MNKYKKIATMVVSTVMAGAMIVPLAACGPTSGGGGGLNKRSATVSDTRFNAAAAELKEVEVKAGSPKVTVLSSNEKKLAYPTGTQINVNIIDSANLDRKISYDSGQIASYWRAIDGYDYTVGDLKPAWWQLGQDLGVSFKDVAQPDRSGEELSKALSELSKYNLINASMTEITVNTDKLLNLADYMEYMPNFQNFLQEYPIVEWSLQMDEKGGMYYIPYFDGNDDIEKYEMVQRDWVKVLLDEDLPTTDSSVTYLDQYKAKVDKNASTVTASAEAFMGTTGSWEVDTTSLDGKSVVKAKVSYEDVIAKLKDANSDLYKAIVAAGVATPQSASGNIIDIQNEIINTTGGKVKGSHLVKVLREYIKVAYKVGTAGYTKLSDVFISSSATWDADLMTALFRCVVTNFKSFKGLEKASASEIYALAARQNTPQRENDLMALAGELYGVRGMESRLEYFYIDNNGVLQDSRLDEASYNAADKLHNLSKEGLLYSATTTAGTVNKLYKSSGVTTFMLHDYVQTQTKDGFSNADFDLAPILTPVSKWDDNSDGNADTIMRFTESWRSVKNGGAVIPLDSVKDPKVLSAVLNFVDYLFSNDGQIIGSYGPMSTNGNGSDSEIPNGFWYGNDGEEVLDAEGKVKSKYSEMVDTVDGEQYFLLPAYRGQGFMYRNVFYKGMQYKTNKQIPIMTDNNMNFYLGKTVNGGAMGSTGVGYKKSHVGNYTDYARGVVGAALPIGNKDQGFEYQCTADCGISGANVVRDALGNETIKHVSQTPDALKLWYTVVPSVLPLESSKTTAINTSNTVLNGSKSSAAVFNATGGTTVSNVYIDIAFFGFGSGIKIGGCGQKDAGMTNLTMQADAASMIAEIKKLGSNTTAGGYLVFKVEAYQAAWAALKAAKIK